MAVCAVGVVESVTFTVKLNEPDAVGVPEMVPPEDSVRPVGKAPELRLQLYGAVPPLATSVVEYAVPTCPDGTELLVTRTEAVVAATIMLSCALAVCAGEDESVT